MKASEVYRKAAEWADINEGRLLAFACLSVEGNGSHSKRLAHMETILESRYVDQWEHDNNTLVLCLLLMSEIAKDEERKSGKRSR